MNNMMHTQTELLPAFLATLLHSIWIGGTLFLFLKIMLRLLAVYASAARYRLSVFTLALFLIFTGLMFAGIFRPAEALSPGSFLQTGYSDIPGAPLGQLSVSGSLPPHVLITLLYVCGVVFFSARLLLSTIIIHRRINSATAAGEAGLKLLERVRKQLGVTKNVQLYISERLSSPALFGFLKPVILVPAGMFTHLSYEQAEVILMHEIVHLKRHDFLVNLIQHMVEVVFFFNPFVWAISKEIRAMREESCDDLVVAGSTSARTYAKALYKLTLLDNPPELSSLAATGGRRKHLFNRIQRILKQNNMKTNQRSRIYTSIFSAMAIALVITLSGFTLSLFSFENENQAAPISGQLNLDNEIHTVDTVPASKNAVKAKVIEDIEVNFSSTGIDSLSDEDREELIASLERAYEELNSIDIEEKLAEIEVEHMRLMAELPERLRDEQERVRIEMEKIDEEMFRKQVEIARQQLDSVRMNFDKEELREKLEMQREQLEKQLESGDYKNEQMKESLEEALSSLEDMDLDQVVEDIEISMEDFDFDFDFDYEFEIDSVMASIHVTMDDIDIESVKDDIERSKAELEQQIRELKSADSKKKSK